MTVDRGSTWNKWDFHVHTPFSILNNGYGFNPYTDCMQQKSDAYPFDEYVKNLFSKAIEKNIVAIGITDYFSIEGYKKVREYLANSEKMVELFPNQSIRDKINDLYIFPNIELRLNSFVGDKADSVNYHVIFSDQVSTRDIEDSFLSALNIVCEGNTVLPLTRHNIERRGAKYKEHNHGSGSDLLVGLQNITVDYKQIFDVLQESDVLKGQYLISVPVDESLCKIPWNGRDHDTRLNLYYQTDLLMTSSRKTRDWALAVGNEKKFKNEFGSIKACIWGSDAHDYDRMFEPEDHRYCWIKAETTFEGLKQILYEPGERVRIQKDKPEVKDEHHVIDYIQFSDDRFSPEPIYLSEGLTTIIGGKSTGKSILLRHIAKNSDPSQVRERENGNPQNRLEANAKVVWKDGVSGESGERKIIYIPQSWLNRVVDKPDGGSQLNSMIADILLQQPNIHSAYNQLQDKKNEIISGVTNNIADYVAQMQRIQQIESELKEKGRSAAYKSEIEKIEKTRESLSSAVGITEEELKKYQELERELSEKQQEYRKYKNELAQIDFMADPVIYISDMTTFGLDKQPIYNFGHLEITENVFKDAITEYNKNLLTSWQSVKNQAIKSLTERKEKIHQEVSALAVQIQPLKDRVAQNDQLKKLENQLKVEREHYNQALALEKEKSSCLNKADNLKNRIISSRKDLKQAYDTYAAKVADENTEETDLKFSAEIVHNQEGLYNAIQTIFDNRNTKSYKNDKYSLNDKDNLAIDDGLFEFIWRGVLHGQLKFSRGYELKSGLERLFSDWFSIHYIVKSGEDTISNMSPGKKALVLLEMVVNLEKGNFPILIDQPEDDLDNRSIYEDLVKYIKSKKHQRQIIVVTHNANVVIGADAEEIIIANQRGKESPNNKFQFEYRCGAIENTRPVCNEDGSIKAGVLNQKGIEEQICDILEGGKDAFELRKNKYFSV